MLDFLTALLSFAATMLILSVIVTSLVETIHRFLGLREKGLELMLGNFYDWVLAKRVTNPRLLDRATFVDLLTANRALQGPTADNKPRSVPKAEDAIGSTRTMRLVAGAKVSSVPVEIFMQRLGELTAELNLPEKKDEILRDFAQKYVAFGQQASHYFQQRARLLSVAMAFAVAAIFNVQPPHLLSTYMQEPLSDARLAQLIGYADERRESLGRASGAAGGQAAEAGAGAEGSDAIADFQRELEALQELSLHLHAPEIPLGRGEHGPVVTWLSYVWFSLAALLIGLGAPFWAQAISTLTRTRSLVSDLDQILKPETAPPARTAREAPSPAPTPLTTRAFEAAETAASLPKAN